MQIIIETTNSAELALLAKALAAIVAAGNITKEQSALLAWRVGLDCYVGERHISIFGDNGQCIATLTRGDYWP